MQRGLIAAALLCLAAAPAPKTQSLLTARDLDPALVLPPPPATDSPQAAAELVELRAFERRDAATEADARLDGDTKNATIFAVVLGPKFDLAHLPATAALMALVRASEKDTVDRGKDHFRRARPYVSDPTLKACKRNDDPLSSYPSGHTSMAFSMAETLARLVPEKAEALLARAARYGQSRIVCEQHFRSDVSAGQMLGLLIAERLMAKPVFRTAFDAARRELVTAGVAR
ncbi:phosphatase PAP2 family protein [Sphingomonas psychrolutea]|uniref:Acid phosphatase n=1 Tax=Sphingomonas psychrolutea TaxID=1259676 RepID=A0ABQ1G2L1_9SPHN|nr:phosphatase PAP2 family protein [Sphingomonas psychrolutea]GGA36236.1 acid phosphatase [Sphingomonas psychrolutea]